MKYTYQYELGAALFVGILYLYTRLQYSRIVKVNRIFQRLVLTAFFAELNDVLGALSINYYYMLPKWIVTGVNSLYFACALLFGMYFVEYTFYIKYKKTQLNPAYMLSKLLGAVFMIMIIHNIFSGYVFSVSDTGEYVHGPLYLLVYATPFLYYLLSVWAMLGSFSGFSKKQKTSVVIYIFVAFSGAFIQLFFLPNVLLSMYTMSLGIVMLFFTLQTPDYQKLIDTMEELEKTKMEAEEAKDAADKANFTKSVFLANMSHEIRTPINSILGMDEILLRENLSENQEQYALNIQNAGNSLLSIVNDILDFSKIESGKMDLIDSEYNLSELLTDCYSLVAKRALDKNLDLKIINDPSIPLMLIGDIGRVRQIIINLLTNAVKYTEKGYVTIGVGWKDIDPEQLLLKISVEDTGIGIDAENVERIFDSFARVDQKKNKTIEGTGLGLPITKQLVELMGGNIRVESKPGNGSTFFVEIPQKTTARVNNSSFEKIGIIYKDALNLNRKSIKYHEKFTASGATILAVDDVIMNLEVVRGLLRQILIKVDFAESGHEALDKIKNKHYDLILMDHLMPQMDGIETLMEMKKIEHLCKDTPVVALTANAIAGDREEYLKAGFTDYIAKPVKGETLEEMLYKYLPKELIEESGSEKKVKSADFKEYANELGISDIKDRVKTQDTESLTYIDEKLGLMYMGEDRGFYQEVRHLFAAESKSDELNLQFTNKNYKEYAILMHALKSTSLNIGAKNLSEEAKKLEQAAKDGDEKYISENHKRVMEAYDAIIDKIREGK